MPRYVALLRGVSLTNCRMQELRECFEAAGFSDERTLLSSGNVAIFKRAGTEAFSVYEPSPKGPVFMTLLEHTFGKDITTRTLATVEKCAAA
ncbi:MAG TPA: DUF1697 domain-containing protein [Gemmatimonas sp.]|nr:DUF1697 domain-containing protein [Gemmatimonas sp.]